MGKIGSIAKWCIIRDSIIQELQKKAATEPVIKRQTRKPVKRKKRRTK